MTTFRCVQRGAVPSSPLVVCFLVGEQCDADLRDALPGVAIVCTDEAPLSPNHVDVELARKCASAALEAPLALVGFSAGCQPVRALRILGIPAVAYVTIDGTAAALPPAPWQIDVWRGLAAEARAGRSLWVATCLQQSYVEHLPPGQAFSWDRRVLEQALGVELPVGTELHDGALHVYSMPSESIDKQAHIDQQRVTLPALVARHLAPWLTQASPSTADTDPAPPPTGLGARALQVALAELAAGVHEVPPGSNAGPRVMEYLHSVGLGAGEPWCAAFASWCDRRAGSAAPGAPSVAGLWRAAVASGHARPASVVPSPGWLAIFARAGEDPRTGGHGHVGRVEYYGVGLESDSVQSIDGNVGDAVSRVTRPASAVLGWIAYDEAPSVYDEDLATRLGGIADALDAGLVDGAALDAIEQAT